MRKFKFFLIISNLFIIFFQLNAISDVSRSLIEVERGPKSVVWIVQLSDLHFSVFHPSRASEFRDLVGPALAVIKPSLVLITGDLTDGKSKDLLIMKQNEEEWIEYHQTLTEVIDKSGLDEKIFYDLRGNHDNFGVPVAGGNFDFFLNYSNNGRLGRRGNVNSVTLQKNGRKHLFVGLDSTMKVGIRGPTNLFGHPTDKLLDEVDAELSQFDKDSMESKITKIAFGHFPLSFSSVSESGRSLNQVFLKHSISAYLCGHLHARFGKNLKRRHNPNPNFLAHYYQTNIWRENKSPKTVFYPNEEFWEWEMGDWRKRRKFRMLAIDNGHVSFTDVDITPVSSKTFILVTYPVDSRFMQRSSSNVSSSCEKIRALIFSAVKVQSVYLKIYDSDPGNLHLLHDSLMIAVNDVDDDYGRVLYTAQWNCESFSDPNPTRYWIQIEAVDFLGRSSFSEMRPFSVNGLTARVDWRWKEFMVMGCQWGSIYQPLLSLILFSLFLLLLGPPALVIYWKDRWLYAHIVSEFRERKFGAFMFDGFVWVFLEFFRERMLWLGTLAHLLQLTFFHWFSGHVFTDTDQVGHMTLKGWEINGFGIKEDFIGFPDVMVIVLPHLCFVILPFILIIGALAAEKSANHAHSLSLSAKKFDDHDEIKDSKFWRWRIFRRCLLLLCLMVLWDHWKRCRSLVKAYDMNPLVHAFTFCFAIPLIMVGAVYKTS